MHWYDHLAILCALLLALWADHDAGIALRASIANYLSGVGFDDDEPAWVRGFDLRRMFGPSVYKHLNRLVEDELIERREEPGGEKRGYRHAYSYRWREDAR